MILVRVKSPHPETCRENGRKVARETSGWLRGLERERLTFPIYGLWGDGRTLGSAAGGNPELEGMNALEGMKGAQLQLGPPSLGGSLAKHTGPYW